MAKVVEQIAEIKQYASSFKTDSLISREEEIAGFSVKYKQLHSILIWNTLFSEQRFPEANYAHYPNECVSDISQSFALIVFSLFKPARMMARSAIENCIRVIVAEKGGAFTNGAVFSLFDEAKALSAATNGGDARIQDLQSVYKDLCKTVHSAHFDHLGLRIPFTEVFAYDQDQARFSLELVGRAALAINKAFLVFFSDLLSGLGHKNKDFVLDSLPKSLKAKVFSA